MSKYDDILYLPHPVSARRAAMSLTGRAAQFSAFAALTGFDGIIAESGRLTEQNGELTEGRKEEINEKLLLLQRDPHGKAVFTWFRSDERKSGGAYVQSAGEVKKIDPVEGILLLKDGTSIPINSLWDIELVI